MSSDDDNPNIAQLGESEPIPTISVAARLEETVAGLRSIAAKTCSGITARRCLRLAQMLDEVVLPAITSLEQPPTRPRPDRSLVTSAQVAEALQTELFELEVR